MYTETPLLYQYLFQTAIQHCKSFKYHFSDEIFILAAFLSFYFCKMNKIYTSEFFKKPVSINFWNILFHCFEALSNPWKFMEYEPRPKVVILTWPLSIGFVLDNFHYSFRATYYLIMYARCFYVYFVTLYH